MKKIKNILILAGGDSTRFWPLNQKIFYPFLGRPLIGYLINEIKKFAIKISVVINPKDEKFFKTFFQKDIEIIIQKEFASGMASAVKSCEKKISGETLILNANDIFNFNVLNEFISQIRLKKSNIFLLAKKIKTYFPGGYLKLKDKKIIGIIEKPPEDKTPSDLVKLTFDYFANLNEFINQINQLPIKKDDVYEKALTRLIQKNTSIEFFLYKDYWFTLKYPWHTLSMMAFFLSSMKKSLIHSTAKISSSAKISGPVYIGKNVKVGDFSKIVGPCYIDDEVTIGDFCLIRESQIGKKSLIGSFSEVARSYLGEEVSLHQNYIGDSVLDNHVEFGAKAVTANFRFDKKEVKSLINNTKISSQRLKLGAIIGQKSKVGVNSSLFPGVKIGQQSLIAPGEIVKNDLPDGVFFHQGKRLKNKLIIT
ncbi:MAG: sugar phosphate nucleotidyltransferase [Microgenomates group bacterium]|nr:sugar phosphate nucleotidyltransferase [Microgenomates group bacterium]